MKTLAIASIRDLSQLSDWLGAHPLPVQCLTRHLSLVNLTRPTFSFLFGDSDTSQPLYSDVH